MPRRSKIGGKMDKKMYIIIGVVSLVLIAIGVTLYFVLKPGSETDAEGSTNAQSTTANTANTATTADPLRMAKIVQELKLVSTIDPNVSEYFSNNENTLDCTLSDNAIDCYANFLKENQSMIFGALESGPFDVYLDHLQGSGQNVNVIIPNLYNKIVSEDLINIIKSNLIDMYYYFDKEYRFVPEHKYESNNPEHIKLTEVKIDEIKKSLVTVTITKRLQFFYDIVREIVINKIEELFTQTSNSIMSIKDMNYNTDPAEYVYTYFEDNNIFEQFLENEENKKLFISWLFLLGLLMGAPSIAYKNEQDITMMINYLVYKNNTGNPNLNDLLKDETDSTQVVYKLLEYYTQATTTFYSINNKDEMKLLLKDIDQLFDNHQTSDLSIEDIFRFHLLFIKEIDISEIIKFLIIWYYLTMFITNIGKNPNTKDLK